MEDSLQHKETAQCVALPPTSPGIHRSDGPQAGHALTFKLDHSMGADQEMKAENSAMNAMLIGKRS